MAIEQDILYYIILDTNKTQKGLKSIIRYSIATKGTTDIFFHSKNNVVDYKTHSEPMDLPILKKKSSECFSLESIFE